MSRKMLKEFNNAFLRISLVTKLGKPLFVHSDKMSDFMYYRDLYLLFQLVHRRTHLFEGSLKKKYGIRKERWRRRRPLYERSTLVETEKFSGGFGTDLADHPRRRSLTDRDNDVVEILSDLFRNSFNGLFHYPVKGSVAQSYRHLEYLAAPSLHCQGKDVGRFLERTWKELYYYLCRFAIHSIAQN
jgi:hypothetical protein